MTPPGDPGPSAECDDPAYGNGTCELSLSCGIADIDCFRTFQSDAEAREWFETDWPETIADPWDGGELLGDDHPAVQRARRLVDRVWAKFPDAVKVGDLAGKHVAVIVLDNPYENAYATSTKDDKSALSLQFLSGIFEAPDLDDESLEGVIAHELAHVVGLHVFPEVIDATAKYYVAPADNEPLGQLQADVPGLRELADEYRTHSQRVGYDRQPAFGDVPGDSEGGMYLYDLATQIWEEQDDCELEAEEFVGAYDDLYSYRRLDSSFDLTANPYVEAYEELKDCYGSSIKWGEFAGSYDADTIAAFVGDEGPMTNKSVFAAIETVTAARREAMADIEETFTTTHGAPWSQLRWYTTEEAADDTAVEYTEVAGVERPGTSVAMYLFLGDLQGECDAAREAGTVPYGKDLDYPHHSLCYRVDHAYKYKAHLMAGEKRPSMPVWREAFAPQRPALPRPVH